MNSQLQESILKTIAWFDIFDFPLTKLEISNYLNLPKTSLAIINQQNLLSLIDGHLAALVAVKKIEYFQNFYFLPARGEIVAVRQQRLAESIKKIKIARAGTKIIKRLPFVRAVILCNVLGYLNAKRSDDIDFLIIVQKNKLWTARWFVAGLFKLLNLRPKKHSIQDKFCFSFYISTSALNLASLKLTNDPYLNFWFLGLRPLYNQFSVFENFLTANSWVEDELPFFKKNYEQQNSNQYLLTNSNSSLKKILEFVFSGKYFEKIFKRIQFKIMPPTLKNNTDKTAVVISDEILKLHVVDRRQQFAEQLEQRIKKINL